VGGKVRVERPAQQQKDLFSKRWRQVKAPQPSELQLQISLVAHLRLCARRDVVFFHVPNGELRDQRTGAKLKAMGELPGVSDLVFVWNDHDSIVQPCCRTLFLELKARKRPMSPEQIVFCDRVIDAGADYHCVDSIDEALELLRAHGILK
jgi:hypothetical protein